MAGGSRVLLHKLSKLLRGCGGRCTRLARVLSEEWVRQLWQTSKHQDFKYTKVKGASVLSVCPAPLNSRHQNTTFITCYQQRWQRLQNCKNFPSPAPVLVTSLSSLLILSDFPYLPEMNE
jgi:hypothetical protein